jgi:hypothetical protein
LWEILTCGCLIKVRCRGNSSEVQKLAETVGTTLPRYSHLHKLLIVLQGKPSNSSWPSARYSGVSFQTGQLFWLFGGQKVEYKVLSDLWYYENGLWTWVHGMDSLGYYGTKGDLSPTTEIGLRTFMSSWVNNNALYVFGGYGYQFELMQEVWVFDIAAGMWAWINGSNNAVAYTSN